MARILPFQGIHYNPDKIESFSDVTTPPYDVISEAKQNEYHARHPNNIIRLILGKTTESDSSENNPHTRAAGFYREWLSKGILKKSETPALYLTAVDFPLGSQTVRRYGLIAKVRLEPFEKKIILPHEKTFSKVKSERLGLMKHCHANFSPIFSLYMDSENILNRLISASTDVPGEMDFTDDSGHRHLLWRFADPDLHQWVEKAFEGKTLFIADGHHRYETALNYRNWLNETKPGLSETHPSNFIMMSLVSMSDPGLVILPAHRIISGIQPDTMENFLGKAGNFFEISNISNGSGGASSLMAQLNSNVESHQLGVVLKHPRGIYLFSLKPGVMDNLFSEEPAALRHLDVTILTRLILMELIGFDQQSLDNEKSITYSSKDMEAIDAVRSGNCDMSFILRPTRIEQVQKVAEEGLIMPRKSTYFFPKVLTGQVLRDLLP